MIFNTVNLLYEVKVMAINYGEIGKRILKRRNVLDITQEQLAEKANISAAYIGNIERATSKCSIETLMKLCTALDVTPDYLLLGVDKGFRNDDLIEIKSEIYRCSDKKKKFIKEFIRWYSDQD